jgi:hypothetical protein
MMTGVPNEEDYPSGSDGNGSFNDTDDCYRVLMRQRDVWLKFRMIPVSSKAILSM